MGSLRSDDVAVDTNMDGALVSRTVRTADVPIGALFVTTSSPRTYWSAPGEPTVAGCGAAVTISTDGPDRFESLSAAIDSVFDDVDHDGPDVARPRLMGGLSFHDGHRPDPPWNGFPAASFVVPRVQLTSTEDGTWLTVSGRGDDVVAADVERTLDDVASTIERETTTSATDTTVCERTWGTARSDWREQVNSALEAIRDGDLTKVVLAQSLSVTLDRPVSPPELLRRLDGANPDCYRFLIEPTEDAAFVGASPELLVSLSGRTLETEALAGSTGRGDVPEEDDWLATDLRTSAKDRHEHELVVDAIRDRLEPVSTTVRTGDRTVLQLPTVQHLRTPITTTLSADAHVLDLVDALHPTPAVGGLPPEHALRTIEETETFDRGWYAAPIGWFDAAGNGTFAVGLRSTVLTGRTATLFAGAGIVADSDPDGEWDEVQLKYRPILDALERR